MMSRCLLAFLLAGACPSSALALDDDLTNELTPRRIDGLYLHGLINGDSSGFGARADAMNVYSNVDLGANSWVFFGNTVHTSGEPIFTEKGGSSALGVQIGPVAAPAKVGKLEFWVYAYDGTTGSHGVPCTITYELFETIVDWYPFCECEWCCMDQCFPSPGAVNQYSLGGFFLPLSGALAPKNNHANQYIIDLNAMGLNWAITDGIAFIDNRCWEYNGNSFPTTISSTVYNCYDGSAAVCGVAPGAYPALGFSFDNFYFDNNGDGIYQRNERYFYGGWPFIANLMFRLEEDDGCSMDLNGDGFVNGDDIGYAEYVFYGGCPY